MPSVEFINDPVLVEAHLLIDAPPEPRAFLWRGRLYRITDTGRQWQETSEEATWRCYLVHAGNATFELRLDESRACWLLARAWIPTATL